jgi:hypothetical protein
MAAVHRQILLLAFVLMLVVTACSGTAATGITAVTPLPLTTPSLAATAVADASTAKLEGNPPYFLTFSQMYSGRSIREGLTMSDYLKALNGKQVQMEGYMAPPLKPALTFFVLTEVPMSLCPFCSSTADWPDNIILVYLNGMTTQPTVHPIRVTGRLEIGSQVDAETGFVSMVRMYADKMEVLDN